MVPIPPSPRKWLPVSIPPPDGDLEVCVIEQGEVHALIYACRKSEAGWVHAVTNSRIDIRPTHWRLWGEDR